MQGQGSPPLQPEIGFGFVTGAVSNLQPGVRSAWLPVNELFCTCTTQEHLEAHAGRRDPLNPLVPPPKFTPTLAIPLQDQLLGPAVPNPGPDPEPRQPRGRWRAGAGRRLFL